MSFCPNCKAEYREGFSICADCDVALVSELPVGLPAETPVTKVTPFGNDHGVFLINVFNETEADTVEQLLASHGIPVVKLYRDSGGYLTVYMNSTSLGVDILVPSKAYDTAVEILGADIQFEDEALLEGEDSFDLEDSEEFEEDDEEIVENEEEKSKYSEAEEFSVYADEITRKRSFRAWIVLLFIMPGLLWLAVFLAMEILNK